MSFVAAGTFDGLIRSLDSDPHRRGKQFEKIVKWWLQNDPIHSRDVKKVWLWDEWPDRPGPDVGIDLVAELKDGSLVAVQAKCFDSERDIPKSELDSFISAASPRKYGRRMLVASTDGLSANARRMLHDNHVTQVMFSYLDSLQEFWPSTFLSLGGPRTISKWGPRTHQSLAIHDVTEGLRKASRGQLIMACGTGKTLTAMWIMESLDSHSTLVLVPSLSLLSQTLLEWSQHSNVSWSYLCVCSDDTVNKSDDAIISSVDDVPFPVTTKPSEIAHFLSQRGRKIIFSTYQSSAQVARGMKSVGKKFDLVICDEAHRLTGKNDAEFATALDDKKIPAKKRLFMTATPRTYTASVKSKASERGVEITSMDDETAFGKELHKLSFGQAIEQELLTDYRVVIVGVTDPQVQELIERRELVTAGNVETDARTLAAHIGLAKATKDYDLKRTISFHGRIKTAQDFAQNHASIVEWMPDDHKPSGTIWADTITGAMNSSSRRKLLDKLKADVPGQHALLSNARCLTEGIDVPSLDGVAFIDPRSSQVDIIQAVGRAIRKASDKALGTIVLPVLIAHDLDVEHALQDTAFKPIWDITNALRSHDENFMNELDSIRTSFGRSGTSKVLPPKIVIDLPMDIDAYLTGFSEALCVKLIESSTQSWLSWYGLLERFVSENGHSRVKDNEIYLGHALGTWVVKQRMQNTRGALESARKRQLGELNGWTWNPLIDDWQDMYLALSEYAQENGSSSPPDERQGPRGSLATWVEKQRSRYRRSPIKFESDKKIKLEAIPGWSWDPKNETWDNMYDFLVKYQKKNNTIRVPDDVPGPSGLIRTWIGSQRSAYNKKKSSLDKDKIKKLEAIPGWSWDPKNETWDNMYDFLVKYQKKNNTIRVADDVQGPNGSLSTWMEKQRAKYRRGPHLFDKDKLKQLENVPGWSWDVRDDKWTDMYDFLVKYQKENNTIRVADDVQGPNGSLSTWMEKQRAKYRRGPHLFDKDKLKQLENVPGWSWDVRDDKWTDMYDFLVKYQKENNTIRVADDVQGPTGLMNRWMIKQRTRYKESPKAFESEREQKLEAIPGWYWN